MVIKTNGFADAGYIRSLRRKALPNRKTITSQEAFNARIRDNVLMNTIEDEGKDLDSFEFKPDVQ